MQTKTQLMQEYNKIAAEHGGYRRKPWPQLKTFINKQKNSLILDLGCGTCSTTKDLLKSNKVIGLDFSINSLKLAKPTYSICGDATNLPIKNNVFDTVIAVGLLHHLTSNAERLQTLKEAKRILKPASTAFFSVWAYAGKKESIVPWGKHKRYYYFFEKEELEQLAKQIFPQVKVTKNKDNLFLTTTS